MFRLEHGRSYLWWFPIFLTAFLGGIFVCGLLGGRNWAVLTLPAFAIFRLSCELRSGIVLDSWWRASYAKGTWQYRAGIAGQVIGLIFFVGLSYCFFFCV
jgi:hypothetical protein